MELKQRIKLLATDASSSKRMHTGNPPPAHLDGSLPGDHGFDPLNLSADPALKKWCVHHANPGGMTALVAAKL